MKNPEPRVTLIEAARRIGISYQALSKQAINGRVRSYIVDGRRMVLMSEVLADRQRKGHSRHALRAVA